MGKYDKWQWPETILDLNGIKRPNVSKQELAVAIAYYYSENFKISRKKIDYWSIAKFINAVGGIHGNSSKCDVPGDRYAKFALKIINNIKPTHIGDLPEEWLRKHAEKISSCKIYLYELFRLLGRNPPHSEQQSANEYLLELLNSSSTEKKFQKPVSAKNSLRIG